MAKIFHFSEMAKFCHLEMASMIFTDSYIGVCHLREMAKFCHCGEMAMAVEVYMSFVTQTIARLFLAGTLLY